MSASRLIKLSSARSISMALAGKTRANTLAFRQLSSTKSWVPTNDTKLQEMTISSMIHDVSEQQRKLNAQYDAMFAKVVPWFLRQMPASYFRQVPENFRFQHVKAVAVLRDLMQSELTLKIEANEEEGKFVTFINSQSKSGLLHEQIKNLVVPANHFLKNVNVFSSLDDELALNIFQFKRDGVRHTPTTLKDAEHIMNYIQEMKAGKYANDPSVPKYNEKLHSEASMTEYLRRCSAHYTTHSNPRRFLIQRELFEQVQGEDGAAVRIEAAHNASHPNKSMSWITMAVGNVLPEVMLRSCTGVLTASGLDVSRAHVDIVDNSVGDHNASVVMIRLQVSPLAGTRDLNTDRDFAESLRGNLLRIKWLDNLTTELGMNQHPSLGLDKAEVITAYCSMLHGPLFKIDRNSFASINSIVQMVSGNDKMVALADSIATLFLDRFNPKNPLSEEKFQARTTEIRQKIAGVGFEAGQVLLNKMVEAVRCTLKTNFYLPERYALGFRLNPSVLIPADETRGTPYGTIFAHGRNFNGFHNRFRDIARGGLRIVSPPNADKYAFESSRQYDEVYNLSYAQQLKNKDIPEGGSKAVVLVNTPNIGTKAAQEFAKRKSVKAFVDSVLDLTVKDSVKNLVDLWGREEHIYLGPDEQVIGEDIDWIINRAMQRGYPTPDAFMSSKEDNGFNHKTYGVTSEGVVVFLDVALRQILGKNPDKDSFSVKITGGPDGDVAGNLMRILHEKYGKRCKIVAVADGFGVAEDPEGLDGDELVRLFRAGQSIREFNQQKLGKSGVCLSTDTDKGAELRNTMHFRVKADVFVPGGGRPSTIHIGNCHEYLDSNKKPCSSLIVEGANIFTTPEAREFLFKEGGVTIVKDSSANKCGVVTSSCEVMACMLLSKQEFIDNKPALVRDVLAKLRDLAKQEAELMFREFRHYPGALPHFSERISFAIAKVTDAVVDRLADVQPNDPLFKELAPLLRENLPRKLDELAGDRIASRFPVQYQRNAIASTLASKIVYKEGVHFVEVQPAEKVAERAFQYFREEQKLNAIIRDVEQAKFPTGKDQDKDVVVDLLKRGGARTSLGVF